MAWPVRYNIVGILTLGTMVNYIDRVNISVAAPDIMQQTGWDEAQFGMIFSAFLVGYTLLQYPGGVIADRWSARKMLGFSCIGFSLFTALTPLGQNAFLLLLLLRFLVGGFESVSFPSLASLNSRWIPRQEYGRAQTLSISGASLGQMIAYPTTAWIIENYSWESVFYFNAALGGVWVTLWLWYSTDTPREHPSIGAQELDEIESQLAPQTEKISVPLWTILKAPSVISLCLSYMFFGFIVWIFILWFPSYLVNERGFSLMQMGLVGMLPMGASFLGIVSGGVISDYLLKRGFDVRFARARFPGLAIGMSLPFLLGAINAASNTWSVTLFVIFYFLLSLAVSGYWAMPLELNPRLVGAISGVMNTSGNLAGIFGPMTAGAIVASTGSWTLPFYLVAVLGVFCSVIFLFFVTTDPIQIPGLDEETRQEVVD